MPNLNPNLNLIVARAVIRILTSTLTRTRAPNHLPSSHARAPNRSSLPSSCAPPVANALFGGLLRKVHTLLLCVRF